MAPDMSGRRHAPRGPVKAKADPIQPRDPMRCVATRRNGEQCGSRPIRGGTVCRMHGGGAPQVKAKAEARLLAMQPKALSTLDRLMDREEFPTVQLQASTRVVEWTYGKAIERQEVKHSGGLVLRHELGD